jgi:integrase
MRRRRGRGEGTVFYHRRIGLWVGAVTAGYDQRGRRRRRYIYGRSKAEVLEQLARLRVAASSGTLGEPSKLSLADYLHRWLEDAARSSVRPATFELYQGLIRTHVNPRLGGVPVARLTPLHIQGLLTEMEQAGASPKLRLLTYGVLHRALGQAVAWGMIPRNPCDAVARPRAPRPAVRSLTAEQARALLQAARGDRLEALYVLAVTTGMRQGELCGLQWEDVDLQRGTVQVRHQLQEVSGRLALVEPKTARSRRLVVLPALAVMALLEHRERMRAEGKPPDGFVFTAPEGGPLRKSNLRRRSFEPLLQRAGLPRIRFHDLRHTAASLLLAEGVHPKVVQEILGHSTVSMTLDTYSHTTPAMHRQAVATLDRVLEQDRTGQRTTP